MRLITCVILALSILDFSSVSDCEAADFPTNGLVVHWRLDETSGLIAADASNTNYDGHLEGFVGDDSQWITGHTNGGLWFEPGISGSTASAMAVTVTNLPAMSNTTWAVWARIDGSPNTHGAMISSKLSSSSANAGHNLAFDATGVLPRIVWNHNLPNTVIVSPDPVDTNWNHIALTYNATNKTLRLYVNGILKAESLTAAFTPFTSVNLGRRGNQQFAYRGGLDDVFIYNRDLDPTEIAVLAGLDVGGPPDITAQPASLVVWEGVEAQFSVSANGAAPLKYQWYRDSTLLSGATSAVHSVVSAAPADSGSYRVVITNMVGSITSSPAILFVRPNATVSPAIPSWLPASGLVLYWNLDNTTQFTALDQSGNQHHGGMYNFPFDGSQSAPEFVGNGVQLYPANPTVRMEVAGLPVMSNTTWAAWMRLLLNQVNNAAVISATFPGAVQGHSLGFGSGSTDRHPRVLWNHGATQSSIAALEPVNEEWNHLAVTYNHTNQTITLYVNGQQAGSNTVTDPRSFSSINVGRREATLLQPLSGMVDEVVVYNRPLSSGEIQSLYEGSLEHGVAALRNVGIRIESSERTAPDGMDVVFRSFWPGQPHEIRGKTNLSDPTWELISSAVLESNGVELIRATVPMDKPSQFLRAVALPGSALFFEDFESGATGWTHGGANDNWELGTPTTGPSQAHSGTNVYATGLGANYSTEADAYLRSPVIDLTGVTAARLQFSEYRDIYPDIGFHRGIVSILNANTLEEIDEVFRAAGTTSDWKQWYIDLPNAAYGTNIIIEFRLQSDPFDPRPGWYIDDVGVTPF